MPIGTRRLKSVLSKDKDECWDDYSICRTAMDIIAEKREVGAYRQNR